MAIKTYTEQLEEVQAAITKILTSAQSYGIGNRNTQKARLDTLYTAEKRLRVEVIREDNGGKLVVKRAVPR